MKKAAQHLATLTASMVVLAAFFVPFSALAETFSVPAIYSGPVVFTDHGGLDYDLYDPSGGLGDEYFYDLSSPSSPVFHIPSHNQNSVSGVDFSSLPTNTQLGFVIFYQYGGSHDCTGVSYSDAYGGLCGSGYNGHSTSDFYSDGTQLVEGLVPSGGGGSGTTSDVSATSTIENASHLVIRDLGGFLGQYLPKVMTVFAGLIALGTGIYFIRKYVARKRV